MPMRQSSTVRTPGSDMRLISPSMQGFCLICDEEFIPHKRRMISFVCSHVLGGEGPQGRADFIGPEDATTPRCVWSMEISKSLSVLGWPPPTVVTSILDRSQRALSTAESRLTEKQKDRGQKPHCFMHHIHNRVHFETYSDLVSHEQRGILGRRGVSTGRFGN